MRKTFKEDYNTRQSHISLSVVTSNVSLKTSLINCLNAPYIPIQAHLFHTVALKGPIVVSPYRPLNIALSPYRPIALSPNDYRPIGISPHHYRPITLSPYLPHSYFRLYILAPIFLKSLISLA